MYDGTLGTKGPWQALVTFQQMVILADEQGVVDMTPEAISRRTTITIEIIKEGIQALEQPDPDSRTPDLEGRRLERLGDQREWGWRVVNYLHYRAIRTADERRDYMRNYQRARRAKVKSSTAGKQSQPIAEVEVDVSKVKDTVGLKPDTKALRKEAMQLLAFLNEKTGRNYQPVPANVDMIVARLRDGAKVEDLRAVVAKKCREWRSDPKMNEYLRPATLFNRLKFAQYQGELGVA